MRKALAAAILGAFLASGAAWADWKKGDAAYKKNDFQTAYKELLPLAEADDDRALYRVARILIFGMGGVPKDTERGLRMLRRAGDLNNQDAQMALGHLYMRGEGGVKRDVVFAYLWYGIAANRGFQDAIRAREAVAKEMSRAQFDEGQRLLRDWKPKKKT